MTQKKPTKRKGVGIDFKKVKHKVGRKLPPAQNATNLSFKSKAIVLPGQSLAQEKTGLALNQRNKSLKELFSQTTHYSERVRKDALLGMKDLFLRHPKELETNVISTIQKVGTRFTDPDKAVRHSLLVLLRSVLPGITKAVMQPLIPMVMAQLGSATTHISNDVRTSAFSFLDLLLQHYPSLLVPYTEELLQYYYHFLGQPGLSVTTMVAVLECLRRFLTVLQVPPAEAGSSAATTSTWMQKCEIGSSIQALYAHRSTVIEPSYSAKPSTDPLKSESTSSLISALLNCWAECVPAVCSSPLPDSTALECMISISASFSTLFDWLERNSPSLYFVRAELRGRFLPTFETRFAGPFPVKSPLQPSSKLEEGLCTLNLGICKVMVHFFVPNCPNNAKAEAVIQYCIQTLLGQLPSNGHIQLKAIEPQIISFLSSLPYLVECVEMDWKYELLGAVTQVVETCHSQSSLKLACLSTMSKVMLLDELKDDDTKRMRVYFGQKWLQTFPRFLWELKHNHASSSKVVLEIILLFGKSAVAGSALADEFSKLQPAMLPFFCTFLPTKKGKCAFGPFIKLPRDCQEMAVDILYYFDSLQAPFLKALATCCFCVFVEAPVVIRILEIVRSAYIQQKVDAPAYLSFIFTVLTGNPQEEQVSPDEFEKKHYLTVGALCQSLNCIGDRDVILQVLGNPMDEHLAKEASLNVLCRFLRVIAQLSQHHGNEGSLCLSAPLQGTLSQQAADCITSQLVAEDGRAPAAIMKYTIILMYRSMSFGRSFLTCLLDIANSDVKRVLAIVRILIELLKQRGIHLEYSDVDAIKSTVKKLRGSDPLSDNKLKGWVSQLELSIKVAFSGISDSAAPAPGKQ